MTFEDEVIEGVIKLVDVNVKNIVGADKNIVSNPVKRAELSLIEKQISDLSAMPDFGYGVGNYCINTDRAKNWQLLSELIFCKDKFSWLDNHIKLASLHRNLKELEDKKNE